MTTLDKRTMRSSQVQKILDENAAHPRMTLNIGVQIDDSGYDEAKPVEIYAEDYYVLNYLCQYAKDHHLLQLDNSLEDADDCCNDFNDKLDAWLNTNHGALYDRILSATLQQATGFFDTITEQKTEKHEVSLCFEWDQSISLTI